MHNNVQYCNDSQESRLQWHLSEGAAASSAALLNTETSLSSPNAANLLGVAVLRVKESSACASPDAKAGTCDSLPVASLLLSADPCVNLEILLVLACSNDICMATEKDG